MAELKLIESSKCFNGHQQVYGHASKVLEYNKEFSIFLPSITKQEPNIKLPIVYYLSGTHCTEEGMIQKTGFQRYAEENKLIVVVTSFRRRWQPDEEIVWDLYPPLTPPEPYDHWDHLLRMYSYVTKELPELIATNFPQADSNRVGITGHSMGGYDALVAFLRNPQIYKAVSACAPVLDLLSPFSNRTIANFSSGFWKEYDPIELIKKQPRRDVKILMDRGSDDKWDSDHSHERSFVEACKEVGQPLEFHEREGYDHSYYFVSTFIGSHLSFLAQELRK